MFVEEVMTLVELDVLRDALVGLPGVSGLSTEQRKRLTIAVELVANPSIIFMDEPTSGLDARAAAIVMRTVRNTVNTGRTVVCTIHQPSIDIFESFDEVSYPPSSLTTADYYFFSNILTTVGLLIFQLLLLKRGGQVIYAGELGRHSHKLVEYFEVRSLFLMCVHRVWDICIETFIDLIFLQSISGVPKITEGYNPATWVLEVSSPLSEARLNMNFAEIYANSVLYR
jgi:hypothetical protein